MQECQTLVTHRSAVEAISNCPHLSQSRVYLKTHGSRVVLTGQVKSFFEKQMAQEALRNIPGINWIDNLLEVRRIPVSV